MDDEMVGASKVLHQVTCARAHCHSARREASSFGIRGEVIDASGVEVGAEETN